MIVLMSLYTWSGFHGWASGPFLEGPDFKFLRPKSHYSKISNLTSTDLFLFIYSEFKQRIPSYKNFRLILLSVLRYRLTKNCFYRKFLRNGPLSPSL